MAIELIRLIEKVSHMDIKLMAGEGGTHCLVRWVHMVEATESSDFVDDGQLVFTTGIGIGSPDRLIDLVKAVRRRGAVGVIVNIGPYIEKIPEEVIQYCNENDYPLYEVPWKIHLAEIMSICYMAITREDQRSLETSAAVKNAIFFPKQEELYVVPLSQRSFKVNWRYSVTVMRLNSITGSNYEDRLEKLCITLDNLIRHHNKSFSIFVNDMEIILVFANLNEAELKKEIEGLQEVIKSLLMRDEEISIGVGRLTKSVRCLYKSYNQALSIEKLSRNKKIPKDKVFYSELGIYRLLMGIDDREIMTEYYSHTLKPLLDYDAVNNSDLCGTLRCYLHNNGSVKETADELFVHRNTINYKLNKIEELLNIEVSSVAARTELMMAFYLQDIL
ncbi:MAG: PucR family transcriptional regulator ligand-binding domain-containing protein [Lachnospiraceae bacterium]|nr:PucR family transcriptional regulator ligand-binding domain-containing protein [Lachnospiraceae bacterium]